MNCNPLWTLTQSRAVDFGLETRLPPYVFCLVLVLGPRTFCLFPPAHYRCLDPLLYGGTLSTYLTEDEFPGLLHFSSSPTFPRFLELLSNASFSWASVMLSDGLWSLVFDVDIFLSSAARDFQDEFGLGGRRWLSLSRGIFVGPSLGILGHKLARSFFKAQLFF